MRAAQGVRAGDRREPPAFALVILFGQSFIAQKGAPQTHRPEATAQTERQI
jgi:hypothetical protein